jgi:two-component system, OmpR family, response regulator
MTRILVIDDEPRITSFVSRALSADGFDVETAFDGARGYALAATGRYELVILDLLLPGVDGVAVLEDLIQKRPNQRVLVLSALSDVEDKVRCLELGASDYLPKPFAVAELIARVRARLREPAPGPDERVLRAGPISLDLVRRAVHVGQRRVSLSEREFLLLERLLLARGDVRSRERLLSEVWGYSFDPGSNVVDVCVGRLRAKLGADIIETVRGVGYRIDAG